MKHFLKYNSGRLHFSEEGEGEAVVLLHGYFETSEIWGSFAKKLSRSFRVLIVDLPGHGLSDVFGDIHQMDFMAGAVKEVIRSRGLKKIFLAGHSMGGYITLAFAELFPEMLSGFCLLHSHPFADPPEVLGKRDKEISLALEGRKDLIYPETVKKMYASENLRKMRVAFERSEQIASSIPAKGIIAVLRGMKSRPSRVAVIEKGVVPFLWVLGSMDNFVNYKQALERVRLPENAEVAILENSGHLGFIEEEEKCLEIMADFIKRKVSDL